MKGKKEGLSIEIDRQVGTHIDVGWFYFKI